MKREKGEPEHHLVGLAGTNDNNVLIQDSRQ
jgi:hypothetical protein